LPAFVRWQKGRSPFALTNLGWQHRAIIILGFSSSLCGASDASASCCRIR
jgi:hypothetical protein